MKTLLLTALLASYGALQFDDYVYQPDPCVEALRGAMEQMEPFLPVHFKKDGEFWVDHLQLTDDGMNDRQLAGEIWKDAKLQCWRH
jgi:hypothetical protein